MKKPGKRQKKAIRRIPKKRVAPGKKISARRVSADVRYSPHGTRDWSAEEAGWYRPIKKPVTLRLDADVIAWFKARGGGYQTRINRSLRELMLKERKSRSWG